MSKPKVYLSGPMVGLTYEEANDWRLMAAAYLKDCGMDPVSPMRGKEALAGKVLTGAVPDLLNSDSYAITARDRDDVMTCDAMIVNMVDADKQGGYSAGTLIEIGWADAWRKPIVLVTGGSKTGLKMANHPIVRGVTGWVVPDVETAVFDVLAVKFGTKEAA